MASATRTSAHLREGRSLSFPTAVLRGLLLSLLMGAAFLLFLALLLSRSEDPNRFLTPAAVTAPIVASLLGGWHAGKLHRRGGALCGISVGMAVAFLALLAALILRSGSLPLLALPLYLGILASATAGGALSGRKKHRHRRH